MKFPALFLAAFALGLPLSACNAAPASSGAEAVRLTPLTIRTPGGERRYSVELARSEAEQARGLMYRTGLPKDGGMLFPFPGARQATFWMKNTLIPLDILFIRADGTIARIASAVPQSLDLIDSGEPVTAVLEIAGGGAAAAGISEGDRVTWRKP